jgi:hypothetical protein
MSTIATIGDELLLLVERRDAILSRVAWLCDNDIQTTMILD